MEQFEFIKGESHIVAAAVHNGHLIRPELLPYLELTEHQRSREEDPYTLELTRITDNRIEVNVSRFQADLNRPREKAIYCQPEDAWGLKVFNQPIDGELVEKSLQYYDEFYQQLRIYLDDLLSEKDFLILYDIHYYNHRREGVDVYADPDENPEVNIGTGNIKLARWKEVVKVFHQTLLDYNFEGRNLDVRENVKFKGGYFTQWIYENYPDRVGCIAIEFKKFFMDEWTNEVDSNQLTHLKEMLIATALPVTECAQNLFSQKINQS